MQVCSISIAKALGIVRAFAKPPASFIVHDTKFHPLFYEDVINFPCPNPDAGVAIFVRKIGPSYLDVASY